VAVHPGAAAVERDWPAGAVADGLVDGPADGRRQWQQDDLGALSAHAENPVAVLFAEIGDVGPGRARFAPPRSQRPRRGMTVR
jgi:hypothetical protein